MKRPFIIRLICYLGFAGLAFSFVSVFSPEIKKLGDFYPAIYGFIVTASFISYVGLWHMKKWGVELYISMFFVKIVFLLIINDLGALAIVNGILTLVFIIFLLRHYPKMDINL